MELDTGQKINSLSVKEIIQAGIGHISEKRLGRSLIPGFSIAQNLVVKDYGNPQYKKNGFMCREAINQYAEQMIAAYEVSTPNGVQTPVRFLSGGNIQKVVLARELERRPRILLAVNPSYGLDVGAIGFVQQRLEEERDRGAAVLLISEELDEVLRLSDRIMVFVKGKIAAVLEQGEFDRGGIGLLMTGGEMSCA
jgi:simple sugar transport system ATP-binding protein